MYHIIVNKASRTGHAAEIWEELVQVLLKRRIEYKPYFTQGYGHATKLASQICQENQGEILLLVVGGDGTANEVINGITAFDRVKFGYIPTGSGNDLGRGLEINHRTPVEQLEHCLDSTESKAMDIGLVETEEGVKRLFAISAGVGVDANVCKQALTSKLKVFLNKLHLGNLTYVLLTVKTFFTMPLCDGHVLSFEGLEKDPHNIIFCAAMNHPWEGGGVPMAPRASAYDGKLSVCCVSDIKRAKCFFYLPKLIAAKQEGIKGFDIFDTEGIDLHLKEPMIVHADGEYCGTVSNVKFSCKKALLFVII